MNLHGIVSGAISAVNPMTPVDITPNDGYTTGDDGVQKPVYGASFRLFAQVQDLTAEDLRKLDGLNIQGSRYSVFINGRWDGVVRPDGKGGDLLQFRCQTWLVVAVLEQWPDWCRLAVTLQNGG